MGGWGGVSLNIIKFVGGEGSRQMKIVCGLRGWLVVFAVCNVCYYSSYCNVGVLMNSNCGGGLNKQMFRPFQLLMEHPLGSRQLLSLGEMRYILLAERSSFWKN